MIEEEKIIQIADLAHLYVEENEIKKYQKQCFDILSEIDKIKDVEIDENTPIMISPVVDTNRYDADMPLNHISTVDAFKNAKRVKNDYLVVPKALKGE